MEQIDYIIIKYLTGKITAEERCILLEWLELSDENKKHFRSLKDAYDLGRLEEDLKESHVKEQWGKFVRTIPGMQPAVKWKSIGLSALRYAAVFLLGVFSLYMIYHGFDRDAEKQIADMRIETGIGDKSKITLPDGTLVWINSCSSIVYDEVFGKETRSVTLQGEAYFEVKKNEKMPFLVHAGKLTYRVTGTSFNVYAFQQEEETSIALLEGGVTIEYDQQSQKLHPGEIFTYNKSTDQYSVRKGNVDRLSSWRQGEFVFDEMTFDELVNRLERFYNVKFIIENHAVRKERFGGTLRDYDSIGTIMQVIKASIPIKYRIEENKVFIQ